MNCAECEILLHALLDDELDAGHAREVEAAHCLLPGMRRETASVRRDALGNGKGETQGRSPGRAARAH